MASSCKGALAPWPSSTTSTLARSSISLQLLHGLARLILGTSKLFHRITFFDSKFANQALIALNIGNMEVDLLLKHDKLFVHLNLQVVSTSLNLSFQLDHFFFLQKHK